MREILCNKYEVLRTIAEGGMGCVYLVKDLHLNRLCAVKVSKGREEQKRSFAIAEKEMLKRLTHPGLPAILDFFEEKGNFCIVMEYVEGITLEQYIRKFGAIREEMAVNWMLALCDVIHYLHSQNPPVIYRDLKPANIMIQPDGHLKLIDFGGAFLFGNGAGKEQLMLGTFGYSAPEQWMHGCTGKAADIYSMGAVLHEMLTGVRAGAYEKERYPVREYDKGISEKLQRITEICLKKRPADRFQSAEELKEALLSYREGGGQGYRFPLKKGIALVLTGLVAASFVLPLLKGVPEPEFPFPYLQRPCLLLAADILYHRIAFGKAGRKQFIRKREKSILLSEKPFPGMYVAGFLLAFLLGALFQPGYESAVMTVQAAQEERMAPTAQMARADGEDTGELFVEMRDEKGRKLLLQEGASLPVEKRVRFEISGENLPEGTVFLQLLATGADGQMHRSRIFLLENVQHITYHGRRDSVSGACLTELPDKENRTEEA